MNYAMKPDMSHDWLQRPLPKNIEVAPDCFIQSAFVFGLFRSEALPGLTMKRGSGIYSQSQLVVGPKGVVEIGEYTCLNSTSILCEHKITIGKNCLLAWGSVITDCHLADRRQFAGSDSKLWPLDSRDARPVVLEDNVWIGFGAVVLPGVHIGAGSVIGCKSVISSDVPQRSVVAGSPPRLIRTLG